MIPFSGGGSQGQVARGELFPRSGFRRRPASKAWTSGTRLEYVKHTNPILAQHMLEENTLAREFGCGFC